MPARIIARKNDQRGMLIAVERWEVLTDKHERTSTAGHSVASDILVPLDQVDRAATDAELLAWCVAHGWAPTDAGVTALC